MTAPPPPPRDDPTLISPAGRRRVVDEEVGPAPPVVRPYPWWLWVLMALFLAAAIVFAVLWLTQRGTDTHEVPSMVGMNVNQARSLAEGRGFVLKTVAKNTGQPAGTVVDQAPQTGANLEPGSQVMAVVSGGTQQVTVPKLIGSTATAAEQLLTSQGLTANKKSVASTHPKGIVVGQDPAEGSKVAKGSSVGLSVSNGQGQVKVPSLQGQSTSNAVNSITSAGLIPIVIQVPSHQPQGTVITQDPAANQQVPAGSKVRVNVSGGPAATHTTTVTTSETTTTATTVTTPGTTTGP
jgi:eukaryotic-like serine/threonine-protein kinase